MRLEWGTQRLLLVQGWRLKAVLSDYLEFPVYGNKSWVPHSSRILA
jgi:hypothetical protein